MKKIFFALMAMVAVLSLSVSADSLSGTPDLERSTVVIHFDGLMAICLGDPGRVSSGLLAVPGHTPDVLIKRIQDGQTSVVAHLSGNGLASPLTVAVEGSEHQISRYHPGAVRSDSRDFRWTVDLETDIFQKQLYVKESSLAAKIHFLDGVFYSWRLSDNPWQFVAGEQLSRFSPRRIGEPAAAMALQNGQALVISGGKQPIRLVAAPGVRYEIAVTNLPADAAHMSMDHFAAYYDAVEARVTRFMPMEYKGVSYYPRPLICNPEIFSLSSLH